MIYFKELDEYLRQDTANEKWHKENPGAKSLRYKDIPVVKKDGRDIYLFNFEREMNNELFILKESRYTELYEHCHNTLEITYVYSGKCDFNINGRDITLKEGELCLLEPNVIHSVKYIGENDIVITIAMTDRYYNLNYKDAEDREQIVFEFLLDCLNKNMKHDKYLIYRQKNDSMLDMTIQSILYLNFIKQKKYKIPIIEEYIRIMFLELADSLYDNISSDFQKKEDRIVIDVLSIIQRNYADCSLKDAARKIGYNYNYLSNLIKKKTGSTFLELKYQQQIYEVKKMMRNTDLPINEIAVACGFNNLNYFYKKFKKTEKCYPSEYRTNNK